MRTVLSFPQPPSRPFYLRIRNLRWPAALCTALALCGVVVSCGGGSSSSSTTTTVAVTISPLFINLAPGQTEQFTDTVTNASNTAVTWEVDGITGGSATLGTISTSGLYTAPQVVPNPNSVTISAVSQQDTTQLASATVTISAAAPTSHIDISPPSATVPAGGQQTFSATVNGAPATVNWSVSCSSSAPGACGSITASGIFTAPLTPPPGGSVSLTATSSDPTIPSANASITIQVSNGTLIGQYAFLVSSQTTGVIAGVINFNGNGAITSGSADMNNGAVSAFSITGGSYHVGVDGRGSAQLTTSIGAINLEFVLVSHAHGSLIRFDSGVGSASGTLDLQDATKFNVAALNGNYTLAFAHKATSFGGSVDGAGAFATNGAGGVASGKLDVNAGGIASTNLAATGSIAAPNGSTGRGTLTLTSSFATQNFAYYIIDATHLKLIELDAALPAGGDVLQQHAGPFANSSFNGQFAATLGGFSSINAGPLALGATMTLDGAGNISTANVDVNRDGNVQSNLGITGSYSLSDATTGRTTASITAGGVTLQFVLYPEAGGALNMLEVDSADVAQGTGFPQQSGAFNNSAILGNFAFTATGSDLITNPGEEDVVGQFVANGGSAFSGVLDINDNGTLSRGVTMSGSYVVASTNGRAPSASLQTGGSSFGAATLNFYVVDANTLLFIEVDGNRVLTGMVQKQF